MAGKLAANVINRLDTVTHQISPLYQALIGVGLLVLRIAYSALIPSDMATSSIAVYPSALLWIAGLGLVGAGFVRGVLASRGETWESAGDTLKTVLLFVAALVVLVGWLGTGFLASIVA